MSETLTREAFVAAYPELALEIESEGYQKGYGEGYAKGKEEGVQIGAKEERERIKAVKEQVVPGHEALIESLMWDGVTTAEQAAVKVVAAEREARERKAKDFLTESVPVVAQPAVSAVEKDGVTAEADARLPVEERAKVQWDKSPEIRAEFKTLMGYTAYLKAIEAGRARIFSR